MRRLIFTKFIPQNGSGDESDVISPTGFSFSSLLAHETQTGIIENNYNNQPSAV